MTWIRERPEGLVYRDAEQSCDGYTLFCNVTGKHATLLDPEGRVVHRWYQHEGIQHAHLLENGHLLIQTAPFRYAEGREHMGGNAGAMMELDWDGNVVWAYRNPAQHHAYERLANGNHVVLAWYPVPEDIRAEVQGGHAHESDGEVMWGDVILEIDRSGRQVRRWNSWEHLDLAIDRICPLENRKEWGHANSLMVTPKGEWLVSFRGTSQVVCIDPDSGAITWRFGGEEETLPVALSHQHAATWLDNGNILIFDNGCHRRRMPAFSRVIEVDPESRKVVWQYQSEVLLAFHSFMCSGASRLANGNTLITESSTARLFEVTPKGETVWEWVSPFHYTSRFGRTPFVFRAYRYALDDPRFAGRSLDPAAWEDLNRRIRERDVPDDYDAQGRLMARAGRMNGGGRSRHGREPTAAELREAQRIAALHPAQQRSHPRAVAADTTRLAHVNTYGALPDFYIDQPFCCRKCGRWEIWRSEDQKWFCEEAKGHIDARAVECHRCRTTKRGGGTDTAQPGDER